MSVFDDDPELLRAALDIIDGWDADAALGGVSLQVADEPEGSTSPLDVTETESIDSSDEVSRQSSAVVSKRPTTARRREEIIYLRTKVRELESQLQTLKGSEKNTALYDARDSSSALVMAWKDVAGRQQRLRLRSELEHARLKEQAEMQVKVAQGLLRLMQKAKRIEAPDAMPKAKRSKFATDVSRSLASIEQIERVDQLYRERHAAFMHYKFLNGTLKFVDISVSEELDDHIVLDVREAWTVPFESGRVLNAVWTYMVQRSHERIPDPDHATTVCPEDGVIVSEFTAASTVPSFTGKFMGTMVSKRFGRDDAAASAVVSTMFVRPNDVDPCSSLGLLTRGDLWLRPVPLPLTERGDPLTLVQCRDRFRIDFNSSVGPASREQAGMLSDFLLQQMKLDVDLRHEVVETLLLNNNQ